MAKIFDGRYTADIDGDFVVFLIGMRVNRFWQFGKWTQVARAMPRMLGELYRNPELGFLGGENFFRFGPLTTCLISYWQSFEHLENYARNANLEHLPAWRAFNKAVGKDGTVGIWHETYLVRAGEFETVYGNMPAFGLANASNHIPATGKRETARRRIGGENEPAVPSP